MVTSPFQTGEADSEVPLCSEQCCLSEVADVTEVADEGSITESHCCANTENA